MIQDILWKAANKLRGSIDAAQYKEFVLGLVFLKYVSDTAGSVFQVPADARWEHLAAHTGDRIGAPLDAAMDAIMRANPALAGVLPRIFDRDNVDQDRLRELVGVIGDARFTGDAQDVLGEVYEYFLERFARAEGKRAGEFYTPASVVRLLVEMLRPDHGRVYDPCCGSGGMFVQAGRRKRITVFGQEANERTWRLAKMNLAIHGIDPHGLGDRWADTFTDDRHPALLADFVLANPPFNMSDWPRRQDDPRWRYGLPPRGNANYAWLQHIIAKLGPTGRAGVVLANGSMSSRPAGEGGIRRAIVEDDLVECMVALPPNLFRTTAIPACVWFLSRDKRERSGQVLFIDARGLGTMTGRTERVLTDTDVMRVADTFHAWRNPTINTTMSYEDTPGFAYAANLDEIRQRDHALSPGRYVGTPGTDPAAEPLPDRIARLTKELEACLDESRRREDVLRDRLRDLP
ncbi:class I SAM-dependent DNA methyltransferase [Actinoplanes sichuanensis]|uniref:site-specific DNA-methyltransferase (adenine-specific) n=1 Tax=Actinoplanes sichuanensis TaxID=512349 RepID=A0ABW4A856_9ACTN|nr:type I restriction-modification system subunit M [Actinoplanes sichuanensis]BEL03512.1 class I SAM-dependent DNA methyltransferase [Actinoplanes sichuanensis]